MLVSGTYCFNFTFSIAFLISIQLLAYSLRLRRHFLIFRTSASFLIPTQHYNDLQFSSNILRICMLTDENNLNEPINSASNAGSNNGDTTQSSSQTPHVVNDAIYELSTAKSVLSFIQSRNSNLPHKNPSTTSTSSSSGSLMFSNELGANSASSIAAAMVMSGNNAAVASGSSSGMKVKKVMKTQSGVLKSQPSSAQVTQGSRSFTWPLLSVTGMHSQSMQTVSLHPDEYSWQLSYDYLANNSLDAIRVITSPSSNFGGTSLTSTPPLSIAGELQVIATPTVGAVRGTMTFESSHEGGASSARTQWLLSWWLSCKKWNITSELLRPIDGELKQIYDKYITNNSTKSQNYNSVSGNNDSVTNHDETTTPETAIYANISKMSYEHLLEKRLYYLQYQASSLLTAAASINSSGKGGTLGSKYTKSPFGSIPTPTQMYISNSSTRAEAVTGLMSLLSPSVRTIATHSLTIKLEKYLMHMLNNLVSNHVARVICVGDVHGCIDELKDLIKQSSYAPGDLVLLLGDMVAKGPDSINVVKMAREIGAVSVRGNHDFEVIRRYIEDKRLVEKLSVSTTQRDKNSNYNRNSNSDSAEEHQDPSYNLKNGKLPDHVRIARELDDKDIEWLSKLPYFIHSPDLASLFVHAGMLSKTDLSRQNPWVMMNMRSSTADGKVSPRCLHHYPWAKHWAGPLTIYFGHDAARGLQLYGSAVGLDTGCVYGEELSGILLPSKQIISVKARNAYIDSRKSQSHRYFASSKQADDSKDDGDSEENYTEPKDSTSATANIASRLNNTTTTISRAGKEMSISSPQLKVEQRTFSGTSPAIQVQQSNKVTRVTIIGEDFLSLNRSSVAIASAVTESSSDAAVATKKRPKVKEANQLRNNSKLVDAVSNEMNNEEADHAELSITPTATVSDSDSGSPGSSSSSNHVFSSELFASTSLEAEDEDEEDDLGDEDSLFDDVPQLPVESLASTDLLAVGEGEDTGTGTLTDAEEEEEGDEMSDLLSEKVETVQEEVLMSSDKNDGDDDDDDDDESEEKIASDEDVDVDVPISS